MVGIKIAKADWMEVFFVEKSGIAVGGGRLRNAGEVMNHSSTSTLGDGQMPNISASLPSGDFESR